MTIRTATLMLAFALPIFVSFPIHPQTAEAPAQGVVRLKVRYKSGGATRDLPRKRFFLFKGSLETNGRFVERIKQSTLTSRECYYRNHAASAALLTWLEENDCESVYCREIEAKYLSGAEAVPEFQTAYAQARGELKNDELARRWLTNYLAPEIRSGFYDEKKKVIQALQSVLETEFKTPVISVMTDRKGTAYFTNIEPGIYTISNLAPSETEKTSILWICEREIKAVDLGTAMKRPFTLSNEKDPKVKCEIIERPLPACASK
jgi:hypothetical protein